MEERFIVFSSQGTSYAVGLDRPALQNTFDAGPYL
jgi:hypothetical protein